MVVDPTRGQAWVHHAVAMDSMVMATADKAVTALRLMVRFHHHREALGSALAFHHHRPLHTTTTTITTTTDIRIIPEAAIKATTSLVAHRRLRRVRTKVNPIKVVEVFPTIVDEDRETTIETAGPIGKCVRWSGVEIGDKPSAFQRSIVTWIGIVYSRCNEIQKFGTGSLLLLLNQRGFVANLANKKNLEKGSVAATWRRALGVLPQVGIM